MEIFERFIVKEYTKDTSADYDHMIGYVSEENSNKGSLAEFLGETREYKPDIKPKEKDAEFPEDWQKLILNFRCAEDYEKLMILIGNAPSPKLKQLIYEADGSNDSGGLFECVGE